MTSRSPDQADRQPDPNEEAIFCPVLGALVKSGELRPDSEGRVGVAAAARAMGDAGVSVPFRSFLAGTSPTANTAARILTNIISRSFAIFELRGGLVAHRGDSGILNNGCFDEAAFDRFVSYSTDGDTMTIADFARASTANGIRDGRRGANIRARANLATLVEALGSDHPDGTRRVSIEALRDLYRDQKFTRSDPRGAKIGLRRLFRILREMARVSPDTLT